MTGSAKVTCVRLQSRRLQVHIQSLRAATSIYLDHTRPNTIESVAIIPAPIFCCSSAASFLFLSPFGQRVFGLGLVTFASESSFARGKSTPRVRKAGAKGGGIPWEGPATPLYKTLSRANKRYHLTRNVLSNLIQSCTSW